MVSSIRNHYPDAMNNFGDRVRALREQAGLSQDEFAARIGMLRQNLSKIETGETRLPTKATQERIASGFDLDFDQFIARMRAVELTPEDDYDPDDRRRRVTIAVKEVKWTEDRERGIRALLDEWRKMDG